MPRLWSARRCTGDCIQTCTVIPLIKTGAWLRYFNFIQTFQPFVQERSLENYPCLLWKIMNEWIHVSHRMLYHLLTSLSHIQLTMYIQPSHWNFLNHVKFYAWNWNDFNVCFENTSKWQINSCLLPFLYFIFPRTLKYLKQLIWSMKLFLFWAQFFIVSLLP